MHRCDDADVQSVTLPMMLEVIVMDGSGAMDTASCPITSRNPRVFSAELMSRFESMRCLVGVIFIKARIFELRRNLSTVQPSLIGGYGFP